MIDGGPERDPDQKEDKPILKSGFMSTLTPLSYAEMSLRDLFAGMAMQGMWANSALTLYCEKEKIPPSDVKKAYASSAYQQADAMLKEREG